MQTADQTTSTPDEGTDNTASTETQTEQTEQTEQPTEQPPVETSEKLVEQPAPVEPAAPASAAPIAPWGMAPSSTLPPIGGASAPIFGSAPTGAPAEPEALATPGKNYSFSDFAKGGRGGGSEAPGAPGGATAAARGRGATGGGLASLLTPEMQQRAMTINLEGVHDCVIQDITEGGDGTSSTVNVRLKQVDTNDTSGKVTFWIKGQDGQMNMSDIKAWCEMANLLGVDPAVSLTWKKAVGKPVGAYQFKKKGGYLNAYPA